MLNVDCHTTLANLGTLRAEWAEAIDLSVVERLAMPTLDWYREALDQSVAVVEPLVMVATADESLLGIVPFVVERRTAWSGVTVRVVRFASSPYASRCAVPGPHPGTALAAAFRTLARRRDWDVLRLDDPTRRPRTRTALRLARMTFDRRTVEPEFRSDPPLVPRLRVYDDGGTEADRYIVWRRRSARGWVARRDPEFRRWLEDGPLVVDLAPTPVGFDASTTESAAISAGRR